MALLRKKSVDTVPEPVQAKDIQEATMALKDISAESVFTTREVKNSGKERGVQYIFLKDKTGAETKIKISKRDVTLALNEIRFLKERFATTSKPYDANEAFQTKLMFFDISIVDHLEEQFPLVYNNSFDFFNKWFPKGEKSASTPAVKGLKRKSSEYGLFLILNEAVQRFGLTVSIDDSVSRLKALLDSQKCSIAVSKLKEYEKTNGRDGRETIVSGGKKVANPKYGSIFLRKPTSTSTLESCQKTENTTSDKDQGLDE